MPTGRLRQRADAAGRAQRVWALRVAGSTWQEAAEAVGFSDGPTALRAVKRYFGELPQPDRDELRALWRSRLELLWRQAVQDVAEQKPGGLRAATALAQRAAALDALDQPQVLALVTPSAEEFTAVVSTLVQRAVAAGPQEADIFEDAADL